MAWAGYMDHGSPYGNTMGSVLGVGGLVPKAGSSQPVSLAPQRTSWPSAPLGFALGGPPPPPAQPSPSKLSLQEYRTRLERIYAVHNPQKLGTLDYLLFEKYKGKEDLLYESVCTKYNIDPKAPLPRASPSPGAPGAPASTPPKQTSGSKVQEWDPATGQMVETTIDVQKMIQEAFGSDDLPEGVLEAMSAASGQAGQAATGQGGGLAGNSSALQGEEARRRELEKHLRTTMEANEKKAMEEDEEEEEEEEYDPFGTTPDDGKRKFQEKVPQLVELDTWLLGEKSGFFEATLEQSEVAADGPPPGKQAKLDKGKSKPQDTSVPQTKGQKALQLARAQLLQQQQELQQQQQQLQLQQQAVGAPSFSLASFPQQAETAVEIAVPEGSVVAADEDDDEEGGSSSSSSSSGSDSDDDAEEGTGEAASALAASAAAAAAAAPAASAAAATAANVAALSAATSISTGVPPIGNAVEEDPDDVGDVAMEDAYGYGYDDDDEVDEDALRAALAAAAGKSRGG